MARRGLRGTRTHSRDAPIRGPHVSVPDFTDASLLDLISLEGRVAVVTGGAAGIGAAVARRLAEAGATVVVADIDEAAAQATAASIAGRAIATHLDVTAPSGPEEVAAETATEHGRLDIWVNNAGIYPSAGFLEMTDEQWQAVMDVNLNGAFRGARAAARRMTEGTSGGVIINIASVSGFRGRAGLAHYSTSKHGMRGLTRSLAVELGPLGIRAVGLAPTMTLTEGVAAAAATRDDSDERRHSTDIYSSLPLGRPAMPDDIARVALFCASDLAALITGETIAVDAGQMSL